MKTLRCSDSALIAIAQDVVDRWYVQPRGTFLQAISDIERSPWPGMAMTTAQRLAFRRIAEAIRTGQGDAISNPAPLQAILQNACAQELNVA
jgi:hypothetical protein